MRVLGVPGIGYRGAGRRETIRGLFGLSESVFHRAACMTTFLRYPPNGLPRCLTGVRLRWGYWPLSSERLARLSFILWFVNILPVVVRIQPANQFCFDIANNQGMTGSLARNPRGRINLVPSESCAHDRVRCRCLSTNNEACALCGFSRKPANFRN